MKRPQVFGILAGITALVLMIASCARPDDSFMRYELLPMPPQWMPTEVDSHSPVFWDKGNIFLFNSSDGHDIWRSSGESLESLGDPEPVTFFDPPHGGRVWLETVWKDSSSGLLYGWYHFEPWGMRCKTAPRIGAAFSRDNGLTWLDQGFIIENGYPLNCTQANYFFSGGNGDFTVILDRAEEFFYFLFSNYGGPASEQGIAIARSAFSDRGQPETVFKYFEGSWEESGIYGRVTPVLKTSRGWRKPGIDVWWGPAVHWNEKLQGYVALLNRATDEDMTQKGVYMAFSTDLLHWSAPQKILDEKRWYPQVIGIEPGETDAYLGAAGRIYVGGESRFLIRFLGVKSTEKPVSKR